ncbi:MAG: nucleoside transporter C-terminal domain-containing protein [Verrucomicrobiota bacterium]
MEVFIQIIRGLIGVAAMLGFAWLLSGNRKSIDWKLVIGGITLQFIFAALVLRVPGVTDAFDWVSGAIVSILSYSFKGTDILFSGLAEPAKLQMTLAITVVGTIVFVSGLTALLYYFRIMSWLVYGLAWVLQKFMRLSGPEGLGVAANVFVGQTEAPLLVKPYLKSMTRSELMALMTGGMATIAGSVLLVYVTMVGGGDAESQQAVAKLLLAASLMSAPAALVMSKIIIPETEETETELIVPHQEIGHNAFDAITRGAADGMKLAINVLAMIIAFYGLMRLGNAGLGWIGDKIFLNTLITKMSGGVYESLSVEAIAAVLFAPVGWLIGVDLKDIFMVGELIGTKLCFTDFIAFQEFGTRLQAEMSPRSAFIVVFALCGFANFASIGVQLGGISAIEPSQRKNLASLGFKAMLAGALASLSTAAVAGIFYSG